MAGGVTDWTICVEALDWGSWHARIDKISKIKTGRMGFGRLEAILK